MDASDVIFSVRKKRAVAKWERKIILELLEKHGWNVYRVAKVMGIDRPNLYRLMRKYGIVRPTEMTPT